MTAPIEYHSSKANVVANALSCRVMTELRIPDKQLRDESLALRFHQIKSGSTSDFRLNKNKVLCFRGRVCVPNDSDLRQSILMEARSSPYTMHPSGNKMYHDLRELYWCSGLKREVADFVVRCLMCQQVKAEYQLPSGDDRLR
ncbi:uncharacterized protein LOC108472004 [Gossypium arboreum]|uniref:uncharacterized protein LOC108472004 n=1 Tax=Gossypium arboreum TaxID=29729 RepID=UPI0008196A9E|nr:uncharacterized protein LOC108472004 [Gossypium arboreum]